MTTETRNKVLGLTALGIVAMLFWNHPVLWPLKILVVFFHELGHAFAALATGGEVVSIELSPQQGGLTTTRGGLRFFVLSAGYLGSLSFGVLWLFLARTPKIARIGVWVLSTVIVGATLWWVRPVFSFGFGFALLASGITLAVARLAPPAASQWILRAIGVFSVLYAAWDIRDDVLLRTITESDAGQLAAMTFLPAPLWGVIWLVIGAATLFAVRKWI